MGATGYPRTIPRRVDHLFMQRILFRQKVYFTLFLKFLFTSNQLLPLKQLPLFSGLFSIFSEIRTKSRFTLFPEFALLFDAIPDAKPVSTFPGIALVTQFRTESRFPLFLELPL
ncbi:hypothetical protein RFM41_19890 [Mesorhizobium sp. VK25A]|uniref:Uncharacterized protein n=1 Tax=Mesorhizobium vachelliae TaxID=3072309 RepID=A0ABU5A704_9HYPH|nr:MULTISPECIES: hypothetical protein [unclassified Mesorhizobium]MDX8533490.1 hypothetical protein [Mesorhizobium sp. VK25D]MDX8546020.1 hypothetical protein [Mesorhizobium sp. VK25A]